MNRFKVSFTLETWSEDPTEWVIDGVCDNLEQDERMESFEIARYEQES